MSVKQIAISLLAGAVALASAAQAAQLRTLPAPVIKALARHRVPAKGLSVFIQDVSRSKPLVVFNADRPRNPASTIKLVTTFIALDALGPAYTWITEAYVDGTLTDGYLDGDLIIKGHGDPFLVTEYVWKFLRGLRDRGVQHVGGDLVIDNNYFDLELEDPAEFDGKPYRSYNALPDALLVNFQSIQFSFLPDVEGSKVRIIPDPWPANLKVVNNLRLKRGGCRGHIRRLRMQVSNHSNGGTVEFSGAYPGLCGAHGINRVVLPPPIKAYGVFKSLWYELGGTIEGTLRVGQAPEDAMLVHSITSRPLAEQIRGINKYSNNVMARQLFLTLGAEQFHPPGTEEKARQATTHWLRGRRLDFPELVLDNGAGLSRGTRISARSMGRLLLAAYRSPYMPEFVSSLAIAGVDGTFRHRLKDEPVAGRAHIKTGTLDGVSAMAGYLLSPAGKTFVVVAMHNYRRVNKGAGKSIQDTLLRWLFERGDLLTP